MELENELRSGKASTGSLNRITAPSTLEGGDILIADHELFVGDSQRTNSNGIAQLAAILPRLKVKAVSTRLFHLLCGVAYLSERTMIISPELVDENNFPGYRFIEIPKEDFYSCDALFLGEGKVLIPSGYQSTATKLKKSGYDPVEVDVSEFYKGDGGVTCLSSPIYFVL
jgi:dimethylargininase